MAPLSNIGDPWLWFSGPQQADSEPVMQELPGGCLGGLAPGAGSAPWKQLPRTVAAVQAG